MFKDNIAMKQKYISDREKVKKAIIPFGKGFLWGLLLGFIGVIVTLCKKSLVKS